MKPAFSIIACLILCACAPEKQYGWTFRNSPTGKSLETNAIQVGLMPTNRKDLPPGCEIIDHPQANGMFYSVRIWRGLHTFDDGSIRIYADGFDLAPYALYDTRQGAIDCAWLCYRK